MPREYHIIKELNGKLYSLSSLKFPLECNDVVSFKDNFCFCGNGPFKKQTDMMKCHLCHDNQWIYDFGPFRDHLRKEKPTNF